jgi:hypothetical protein
MRRPTTVCRVIKRLDLQRKKLIYAGGRESERIKQVRREWKELRQLGLFGKQIFFLD